MNREILFRGKRLDNGEWVEAVSILSTSDGDVKEMYIAAKAGMELAVDSDGNLHAMTAGPHIAYYRVDPNTVGQFTGLTDKNGRKVFEGDVLKFTDESAGYEWIGRVEFGNPNGEYNWGFQLVYITGTKANTDTLLWFDMEESGAYCEVIGNIYDNPELLEE